MRCELVTGVQTCARPICWRIAVFEEYGPRGIKKRLAPHLHTIPGWRVAHVRYSQQHLTASSGDHHRREGQWQRSLRSEEHTSELQSLMRISYAVFCLQQKKHTQTP